MLLLRNFHFQNPHFQFSRQHRPWQVPGLRPVGMKIRWCDPCRRVARPPPIDEHNKAYCSGALCETAAVMVLNLSQKLANRVQCQLSLADHAKQTHTQLWENAGMVFHLESNQ